MNDMIWKIWQIICVSLGGLILILLCDVEHKIIKSDKIQMIIGWIYIIFVVIICTSRIIYESKPINKYKMLIKNIERKEKSVERAKRELEKFYIDYPQFKENE